MGDARASWVRAVGAFTYEARSRRADRHEAIADAENNERSTKAQWHFGRAAAQRTRIERVEACGGESIQVFCAGCGVVHDRERRCGGWRYCLTCRGKRAERYRARFTESRNLWLRQRKQYERERFLTLTLPHSGTPADDVRAVIASWERFIRTLRRWLRRRALHSISYLRALEVTSSDGGHAHLHAWCGSPFLPHAVLRVLWGRSLSSAYVPVRLLSEVLAELPDERSRVELLRVSSWRGRLRQWVPWPVLDVRAVHGDPSAELVKYMLKDIGTDGAPLDPEIAATLIEATEGTRTVAASRGFWASLVASCPDCGESKWLVLQAPLGAAARTDRWEPGSARFP